MESPNARPTGADAGRRAGAQPAAHQPQHGGRVGGGRVLRRRARAAPRHEDGQDGGRRPGARRRGRAGHRGPRPAPAVEVLEWETPATTGAPPAEPHHIGISALGYAVPSIDLVRLKAALYRRPWTELAAWPLRGSATVAARTTDLDGVPIELTALAGGEAPVFSHLRINVTDLDASVAWYERLGFTAQATARSAQAGDAVLSYASMVAARDASFSP